MCENELDIKNWFKEAVVLPSILRFAWRWWRRTLTDELHFLRKTRKKLSQKNSLNCLIILKLATIWHKKKLLSYLLRFAWWWLRSTVTDELHFLEVHVKLNQNCRACDARACSRSCLLWLRRWRAVAARTVVPNGKNLPKLIKLEKKVSQLKTAYCFCS